MPPPTRTQDADYHFHVYDFNGSAAWQPSAPQPARNNWQFFSMAADLQGLLLHGQGGGVPNIALTNLGAAITDDGVNRHVMALSFGNNAIGTDEVVITGGIHAREWIAPEMAYLLAEYLIRNYPAPAVPDIALTRYEWLIRHMLNTRRVHIIPMVNPAGNAYTAFSADNDARLWRRNRRPMPTTAAGWQNELTNPATHAVRAPFQNLQVAGNVASYDAPRYQAGGVITVPLPNAATVGVDLNRNFATNAYGHNCGPSYRNGVPGGESYFGPGSGSELETRNIQAFFAGTPNLETSIDYHSYGKLILYPSELFNNGNVNAGFVALGNILQQFIAPSWSFSWSYDYQLGSPEQLLGYDATGTLADYAGQQHASRSFVVELDPGDGLFSKEFELPENQIRTVFEKNIRGALALIVAAGMPSTFTITTEYGCFKRKTISAAERRFLDWDVYDRGNQLPA